MKRDSELNAPTSKVMVRQIFRPIVKFIQKRLIKENNFSQVYITAVLWSTVIDGAQEGSTLLIKQGKMEKIWKFFKIKATATKKVNRILKTMFQDMLTYVNQTKTLVQF